MRRLIPVLALLACTASAPAEQPAPAGAPAISDSSALKLEPGELLRMRGTGGACTDDFMLVVHADGRFDRTPLPGCEMKRPPGPPPPSVRAAQLDAAELAQLNALLADPALAHTLTTHQGSSSSTRPLRQEILVRTPTGDVRGEYIGHRMHEASPFHAFLYALYARL